MKKSRSRLSQYLIAGLISAVAGCGSGFSIVIRPQPEDCYRQDVIETGCYPLETVVTFCEEDFWGILHCYDDVVMDVVCEDVVVDSYLICD